MTALQWAVIQANLNPAIGTEQKGTRPVLIVSSEDYNQTVPNVTVLPLTSTKRHLYPSETLLPEGKAGQPLESIVMAHQIRSISKQPSAAQVESFASSQTRVRKLSTLV